MQTAIQVRLLSEVAERELRELSDVLIDCVEAGASVSFMYPMTREKAEVFWRHAAECLGRRERLILVAEDSAGTIVGTVQVILDQPENQPHRADVSKMLVHRRARRQGVGAALLTTAEEAARSAGKTLLVLDTANDTAARLYERHGWQRCGEIPNYALWPGGGFCATLVYYKSLPPMQ